MRPKRHTFWVRHHDRRVVVVLAYAGLHTAYQFLDTVDAGRSRRACIDTAAFLKRFDPVPPDDQLELATRYRSILPLL